MKTRALAALVAVSQCALSSIVFAQDDSGDEVFELSPFQVDPSGDTGYRATNTLAGTRMNTNLGDIAASVSVFTEQFIEDLQIQNVEELADYTLNQRIDIDDTSLGWDQRTQANAINTVQRIRIRGLQSTQAVDYFRRIYPSDGYNINRYDESRGPNGILFGIGSAGGVTNTSTWLASTQRNYGRARLTFDHNDGMRQEIRYNHVLIEDKLGINVAGLNQEYAGWQHHAWNDRERVHGALTYKANDHVTLRLQGERGTANYSTQQTSPPLSFGMMVYTDWANSPNTPARLEELGLPGLLLTPDNGNASATEQTIGIGNRDGNANSNERFTYVVNDGTFFDAAGTFTSIEYGDLDVESPDGWTSPFIFQNVGGRPRINRPDLFPYEINVTGPGQFKTEDFSNLTFNADFKVNENFYLNYAHNEQSIDLFGNQTGGFAFQIVADRNLTRGVPDSGNYGYLDENPYGGYLHIDSNWSQDSNITRQTGDRVSLSYDFDFRERDGFLSKLGTHTFAAMHSVTNQERHRVNRHLAFLGAPFNGDFDNNDNKVRMRYYFPLEQAASDPASIHIPNWQEVPSSLEIDGETYEIGWVNTHHNSSANYQTNNTATEQEFKSYLAILQSRFLDNRLVTTLGYRKDDADLTRFGYFGTGYEPGVYNPDADFVQEPDPLVGRYIDTNHIDSFHKASGEVKTIGAVFKITDNVSLTANHASNVGLPDVTRQLLPFGQLPDPSDGEGLDYGIRFRLFDDRVHASLTYYESDETGLTNGGGAGGRFEQQRDNVGDILIEQGVFTAEEWDAEMEAKGYNIEYNGSTYDLQSHGIEFAVTANITDNWRLSFNASKVDRLQSNTGQDLIDFYGFVVDPNSPAEFERVLFGVFPDEDGEYRITNMDAFAEGGFARDIIEYAQMATARDEEGNLLYDVETTGGIEGAARSLTESLYRHQSLSVNNTRASNQRRTGLRPYSANVLTFYDFTEGFLKGFGVGGGLVWQDAAILGVDLSFNEVYSPERFESDLILKYSFSTEGNSLPGKWAIQLNISNIFDEDDIILSRKPNINLAEGNPYTEGGIGGQYQAGYILPGDWGPNAARYDFQEGRTWRLGITYDF